MAQSEQVKRRDKALTIQKICDAALEVFSTHSYEMASTKKIAEKAGVNSALIFNYFDSKQGLFDYVFDKMRLDSEPLDMDFGPTCSLPDDLVKFAGKYIDAAICQRSMLRSVVLLHENFDMENICPQKTSLLEARIGQYQEFGKISRNINAKSFATDFIYILDATIITYCINANESKEDLLTRITPVIGLIASGLEEKNSG